MAIKWWICEDRIGNDEIKSLCVSFEAVRVEVFSREQPVTRKSSDPKLMLYSVLDKSKD